jgi:hypothetical protein
LAATLTVLWPAGPICSQGVQIEKAPGPGQTPAAATPVASTTPSATPAITLTASEVLYDYVQRHQLEVAKYQVGNRYIWTDRVLIEITDAPPPEPLASLLAAGPNNTSQFSMWVHDNFETQTKAWHPAKRNPSPSKQGTEEIIGDSGNGRCYMNPVYMNYVMARYPKANILIKGPTDPVLFTVNGQVRAIVSPWTQLPDGTPLL